MSLASSLVCMRAAGSALQHVLSSAIHMLKGCASSGCSEYHCVSITHHACNDCLSGPEEYLLITCIVPSGAYCLLDMSKALADTKNARGARLGSAQLAEITPSEPDHGHACVGKHSGVLVMQGRLCSAQRLQGRCHTCQIT